jgi:hypothetical protein
MQDAGPDGLDPFVRKIVRQESTEVEEPPDMALSAYLTGKANAAEKTAVRRVLSQSAAMRDNVVELGEYIETLPTDVAAQRFREAEAPPFNASVHDLPEPVKRVPWGRRVATAWQHAASAPAWKLTAVSATLVLVVVGAVGSRMFSFRPLVVPALESYDAEIFALRRGDVHRGEPPAEHYVAALRQFSQCIAYQNGELEFDAAPARPLDGGVTVRVDIVDSHRRKLDTLTAAVAGDQVQLWIASQPASAPRQVEVRSLALNGRSGAVRLSEIAAQGVWLMTYERNGRLYATECAEYSVAGH